MATNPIGGGAAIVTLPGAMPPMPAVARILARHDRQTLASFVTVAIDLMDAIDGDMEAEAATWPEDVAARPGVTSLPDDSEPAGDEQDAAWIEWHALHPTAKRKHNIAGHEDTEDDDPAGVADEDGVNTGLSVFATHGSIDRGPGCPISDPHEAARQPLTLNDDEP